MKHTTIKFPAEELMLHGCSFFASKTFVALSSHGYPLIFCLAAANERQLTEYVISQYIDNGTNRHQDCLLIIYEVLLYGSCIARQISRSPPDEIRKCIMILDKAECVQLINTDFNNQLNSLAQYADYAPLVKILNNIIEIKTNTHEPHK